MASRNEVLVHAAKLRSAVIAVLKSFSGSALAEDIQRALKQDFKMDEDMGSLKSFLYQMGKNGLIDVEREGLSNIYSPLGKAKAQKTKVKIKADANQRFRIVYRKKTDTVVVSFKGIELEIGCE